MGGAPGVTTKVEIILQKPSEAVVVALRGIAGVKGVQSFFNGTNRIIVESEPREEVMAEMARLVVGQGAGLVRMSPVQLMLEDYYLGLIGVKRSDV